MDAESRAVHLPAPNRTATFAASKFASPISATRHVARPALCARLDAADVPLRLVIGSPGSGKTALLAEWFHSSAGDRACWLNADDGDRDPVRFWQAFITAARSVAPTFADSCLDMLRLDPQVDHELLEALLVAVDELDHPVVVVVDDFHAAGSEVSDHLRFLLQRTMRRLQVVLGTRAEPDIGLQRLRMNGEMHELREVDLRFERADAGLLLERLGVCLDDGELDIVIDRTEGWAAGLQLTALALRDAPDPRDVVGRLSGTTQVIAHYLWSEVYQQQPPDVQRFLLDTCVVDELSPALAAALSPGNSVGLLDVEAASLLLRRVDAEGSTFRFHHLLLGMLRFRLRGLDPSHEAVLDARAASWHDEHGDPVEAFRHRWRAGRRAEALQSMHGNVLDVVYDALTEMTAIERGLTDDDIRAWPAPASSYAAALLISGLAPESARLADRIDALAGGRLDTADRQQLLAVQMTSALVLGDTRAATGLGQRLPPDSPVTGSWPLVMGDVAARSHIWEDELDLAELRLQHLLPPHATTFDRAEVQGALAHLRLARGQLTDCSTTAAAVLSDNEGAADGPLLDGMFARALIGTVLLERGELHGAERELRTVSDDPSQFRVPARVLAKLALARLWSADGKAEAALVVVEDAYRLIRARPKRSGILDHVRREHVRVLVAVGHLEEANTVLTDIVLPRLRLLATVEVALERTDLGTARLSVERLAALDPTTRRHRLDLVLATLAVAAAAGEPTADHAAVAFGLAMPEEYLFPIAEAGAAVLTTIQEHARHEQRTPYVDRLLRLRPRAAPRRDLGGRGVDVLTERERMVLRYLATAMSYSEIAAELYVSLNTVKSHVKRITHKLQANSRQSAVERAVELHYL